MLEKVYSKVADKNVYVDWGKRRVVKRGLAAGTYYPIYRDKGGKHWMWWEKRALLSKAH